MLAYKIGGGLFRKCLIIKMWWIIIHSSGDVVVHKDLVVHGDVVAHKRCGCSLEM